jgi:hypothetical protein
MDSKRNLVIQQLDLMEEIRQKAGINIVTCGHCGTVVMHKQETETIKCYDCEFESDPCDFPDLFYTGMELNEIYNEPKNQ